MQGFVCFRKKHSEKKDGLAAGRRILNDRRTCQPFGSSAVHVVGAISTIHE